MKRSLIRKTNIGFVFQNYHLNPYLKAYENVILPMYINENIPKIERKKRALELLELVNLSDRTDHYPKELSGENNRESQLLELWLMILKLS